MFRLFRYVVWWFFLTGTALFGTEHRISQLLGPTRFLLDTGDTVRLAFVDPPFPDPSNPDQIQFHDFVTRLLALMVSEIPLRIIYTKTDESPAVVHLFNDRAVPPIWLNHFLLASGYGRFKEEADTTHRAACLRAAASAQKKKLGLHAPSAGFFANPTIKVLDTTFPDWGVGYHDYRFGQDFHCDLWFLHRHEGGRTHVILFGYPRYELHRGKIGLMVGGFFAMEEKTGIAVPLWGLRAGAMEKAYASVDVLLILPLLIRFHVFLRYPHAQGWIGVVPLDLYDVEEPTPFLMGLDLPIGNRLLLKAQGMWIGKQPQNNRIRIGLGYVF